MLKTTLPGTGKVVGGTELEPPTGAFREIDALHHISLVTGALEVTDTPVVSLDDDDEP